MYHTLECIVFWDRALHPPVTPHFSFHICRFSHLSTEEVYPVSTLIVIYHLSMHLFYPLSTVYHLSMVKCWPIFTFVDEISPNYYICRWFIICRRFDVCRRNRRAQAKMLFCQGVGGIVAHINNYFRHGNGNWLCMRVSNIITSVNNYYWHTCSNVSKYIAILVILSLATLIPAKRQLKVGRRVDIIYWCWWHYD